ncbi:5'-nucleotidase C-terminal domain-containing protein [Metabacillus fastidiosus]|uniref:5'-nucleotidase C-terminal domain-containing protein n=1 Tax=Metabacillus fastidiosus TaxID=1458 RepID=UPI002E23C5E0|nr:5'-nucleotidase C-terminal domain-containing protein [Metabacillus fastidiosus]MED4534144.1 5'-nucleotidase C-terminal domain-containing protein [Metabacillus fastidiosus]
MSYKNNKGKKLIVPALLATAIAASTAPIQADASAEVSKLVNEAQLSANNLIKFYDLMNQKDISISKEFDSSYKKAAQNIKAAKAAVEKVKDSSIKEKYIAQLELATEKQLKAARVIDAIKTGNQLTASAEKLNKYVKAESLTAETVESYHQLSKDIKKAEDVFSKVYGEGNRNKLRSTFLIEAKIIRETVIYEVSGFTLQEEISQLFEVGKVEEAKAAFGKLTRLEDRAIAIKEAGNKLFPGKYPSLAKMSATLTERKKKLEDVLVDKNFELAIMHTNDSHANLDHVAKKVTAVKEVRVEKPNSLLLDAGDVFSGTLYFNEFKGQADLEFMNLLKYDAMTFGNHEFDLGSTPEGHKGLADFVKGAKFPFVSSNVDFSKDEHLKGLFKNTITNDPKAGEIYNGIVKEVNGEKIGIFGLTTEETKAISSPNQITFSNYLTAAENTVKEFEKQGINKIIAVTHIGYDDNPAIDNDIQLATKVKGIDVIVGGHSHTQLSQPTVIDKDENGAKKDPTVIVQAFQYNEYLGTLDVEFDKDGKITGEAGKLIKIADKKEDEEAANLLKKYSTKIAELKNRPTGATTEKELVNPRTTAENPAAPSVRNSETELGNLITDGMLDKAKAYNPNTVIAMQNGGGIRSKIDAGEITYGDVIAVLPFGNTLATMKLTGAEIIQALEHSVQQAPKESGGFLHVSGLKVKYDSSKQAGQRIVSVEVEEKKGTFTPLDSKKEYAIATNAFTAKGGDGFDVFKKAYEEGRVTDLGLSDWENLKDYVAKIKTVSPKIEGRIIDTAAKN